MVKAVVVTNKRLLLGTPGARVHHLMHIRLADLTVSVIKIDHLLTAYQCDFYLCHGFYLFITTYFPLRSNSRCML